MTFYFSEHFPNMMICRNCGGGDFSECFDKGDYVCNECGGCSPEKIIDETPEKRNFVGGKDHSRCSEINYYIDFAGQNTTIKGKKKGTGNILQKLQNQLVEKEMSLSHSKMTKGFSAVKKFQTMFSLNGQIVDTAKNIIAEFQKKQANGKKRKNGTTSDEFVLSVIYMSMEIHHRGVSFKEVCATSRANEKKVRQYIKTVNSVIPEKVKRHSKTPIDHVLPISSAIAESINSKSNEKNVNCYALERFAVDILQRAFNHSCNETCENATVSGKRPSTLASAAIWVALKKLNIEVPAEDVSVCAQIGKDTMLISTNILQGHWEGMFDVEKGEDRKIIQGVLRDFVKK